MSASALMRWATRAASRSLSPNRISLVATVSFSLITGTACSVRRRSRVRWAFAALSRRPMSAAVSSTCPTTRSYLANESPQARANSSCPTLAAACLADRVEGRAVIRSGAIPAPIAPDETTKTSDPAAIRD